MADQPGPSVYEKGLLYQINLNDLLADPNQPRKSMDAQGLEEMTASVGKVGIIQPIIFRLAGHDPNSPELGIVSQDSKPQLVVVAGERSVAAARKVGLTTIPAIFIDGNYSEIALVENLLRQDLTAVEEAEGLQALMTEQKYTQEQLGNVIGKARQTINEILTLNKLPQEVRDDCRGDRTIARNTLITIARKKQVRAMTTAYNAHKAKQQKEKTPRTKTDPTDPQPLFDMMEKAITKIKAVDTTAWTDDGKAKFKKSLTSLKTEVDAHLAALTPKKTTKKLV